MSDKPLPYPVWPSTEAEKLGWREPERFNWPGKAVHRGESSTGKMVTQFLLRDRKTGFLVLETWEDKWVSTEDTENADN